MPGYDTEKGNINFKFWQGIVSKMKLEKID